MDIKEVINRIGIIRTRANLSARELSLMLDKSSGYINKLETTGFKLSIDTLLEIINICGSTPEEFFYENLSSHKIDKDIIMLLNKVNPEKKQAILSILKN